MRVFLTHLWGDPTVKQQLNMALQDLGLEGEFEGD